MTLSQRIEILVKLGRYMAGNDEEWMQAKDMALRKNGWFLPAFIDTAVQNIVTHFLQQNILEKWVAAYPVIKSQKIQPKLAGLVMAGNIPLVGFHDFMCVFLSGHHCLMKTSSKDETLITHLVEKMISWEPSLSQTICFATLLKGSDAYIATGSNNTAGYFEYYFSKYPHIIRKNKTSVAIVTGKETPQQLAALADDIHLYFGMGCRNITKIFVPEGYNFVPLLEALKKYNYLAETHKYKNNYDYNLALLLLNHTFYMSTPALLLVEDKASFSPVSVLYYEYYLNKANVLGKLINHHDIQGIVGQDCIPFGTAQSPAIDVYADGVDTMQFLSNLS